MYRKCTKKAILKHWIQDLFIECVVWSLLSSGFILDIFPSNLLVKLVKIWVTVFSLAANNLPKTHLKGDFETLDPRFIYWMCSVITFIFWIYLKHNSHQAFSEISQDTSYGF